MIINADLSDVIVAALDEKERELLQKEQLRLLRAAISTLSVIQRRRISLYYEEGMTEQQIADLEGVKHQAVHHTLSGARKKIRKYFLKRSQRYVGMNVKSGSKNDTRNSI
jgi:RNA polymerase sigma factor (sigma-70 family)